MEAIWMEKRECEIIQVLFEVEVHEEEVKEENEVRQIFYSRLSLSLWNELKSIGQLLKLTTCNEMFHFQFKIKTELKSYTHIQTDYRYTNTQQTKSVSFFFFCCWDFFFLFTFVVAVYISTHVRLSIVITFILFFIFFSSIRPNTELRLWVVGCVLLVCWCRTLYKILGI